MGCGVSLGKLPTRKAALRKRLAVLQKVSDADKKERAALANPNVQVKLELLSEVPIGVFVWSDRAVLIFANSEALHVFEHDETTLKLGNKVSKVLDLPKQYHGMCYRIVDGVSGRTRTGKALSVSLYTTLLDDQVPNVFCGIVQKHEVVAGDLPSPSPSPRGGQQSPKRLSDLGASSLAAAAVDRLLLNTPDIVLVVDSRDGALVDLSYGARVLFSDILPDSSAAPPPSLRELQETRSVSNVDDLLSRSECRSLALFLPTTAAAAGPDRLALLDAGAKQFAFGVRLCTPGVDPPEQVVDTTLEVASSVPMAGELLIVRLQPPPKRRGVVFVRKLIPDETAAVIDTLPEPALLVSSRGRIEYWNHECARLFGCRLELVLGRSLAELIPYPYHASHLTELPIALVRQVLTESQQVVGRHLRTGKVIPLLITIRQLTLSRERPSFLVLCKEVMRNYSSGMETRVRISVGSCKEHPLPAFGEPSSPFTPLRRKKSWSPASVPPPDRGAWDSVVPFSTSSRGGEEEDD